MANIKKPENNVTKLKSVLKAESVQEQFANALGEQKNLFVASLIDLVTGDDNLKECDPNLIITEALKAAVLKLPITKSLGLAWIIPYKRTVSVPGSPGTKTTQKIPTFMIGYKGLIQLALRSGQYRTINAGNVYEGELTSVDKVTGKLDFSGTRKSDKIVGYFAHFELINGFMKTVYWTKEEVIAHAKRFSPSFNFKSSPWQADFDSMAKKTLIRNLIGTWGILTIDMQQAFEVDKEPDVDLFEEKTGTKSFDITDIQNDDKPEEAPDKEIPNPGF